MEAKVEIMTQSTKYKKKKKICDIKYEII